jgi:hypothetical protein
MEGDNVGMGLYRPRPYVVELSQLATPVCLVYEAQLSHCPTHGTISKFQICGTTKL